MTELSVSALVLAGGKSERMGRDKRFLSYNGQPFIARVVQAARAVTDDIRVLVAQPGDREELSATLERDVRYISDPHPDEGPMGALAGALGRIPSDYALLVAVDYPLLSGAFLQRLCGELAVHKPPPGALVPHDGAALQVACALYHRTLSGPLATAFARGERSLRRWLEGRSDLIAIPEARWRSWAGPNALVNVNTPEDYRRLPEIDDAPDGPDPSH